MAVTYEVDLKDGVSGPAKTAAAATDQLRGALSRVASATNSVAGTSAKLTASTTAIQGGFAGATGGVGSFAQSLGIIPVINVGAVLSKMVGLLKEVASAALDAATSLVQFVLNTADSKRNLLLQMEALTGSSTAARALVDQIDAIAAKGLVADNVLEKMARELAAAGFQGAALSKALDSVATVTSVLGDEAGQKITALYQRIQAAGGTMVVTAKMLKGTGLESTLKAGKLSAEQLGEAIKTRFGDVAAKQALGLQAQFTAFKHNLGELFEDVDIEPLLKGLKSLTSILDQNTASGRALKGLLTGAFTAIGAIAAKVFPAIKAVMLQVIIETLKVAIALKPLGREFSKLWSVISGGKSNVDVVSALAFAVQALVAPALVAIGVLTNMARAAAFLAGMASAGASAAAGLISSIVSGITNGISRAVAAVKKLGTSIVSALKDVLQFHSPSPLFIGIGEVGIGGSVSQGVERSIPKVTGATKQMGHGAIAGTMAGARGPAGESGKGDTHLHFAPGAFQINGAGKSAEQLTETMLSTVFERIKLAQGL